MNRNLRYHFVLLFCLPLVSVASGAAPLTPEELNFFETKIRPVLIKECYGCHSSQAGNVRGGLRLDSKELMRLGGSSGPAVVPGDLEESLLFNAIKHEDFVMPPKRQLAADVIDDFRRWIEMGAPDPRENQVAEIKPSITDDDIREAQQTFWAYQSPRSHEPPSVQDHDWPATDVDRFVLHRLESADLQPAKDAAPYQVIRRLSFDLVGLPPTPEEIDAFESDWKRSPQQAVESKIDELLAREQFGERWGRYWLDVARYGESTGREVNMTYPHAWRYRDYVIDSFNQDKPFDRFVQEQIAGDLIPAKTDQQWAENLVATTFLAIGPKKVNEQNRIQFEADLIDEQIDATTRVFLGTSVACARCHDHKFDAIPQTDYYALAGIFRNALTYFGNPPSEFGAFTTAQLRRTSSLLVLPIDDPNPFDKRYSSDELAELRSQLQDKMREAAEGRRRAAAGGTDAQNALRNRLRLNNEMSQISAKLAVVDDQGNPRSYCMGVQEREASPQNARLLVRGEIDQAAQEVERGFPKVLCSSRESIEPDSSGRLELARWIGSDRNPLTARVMVNRIWQQLMGRGIVASTENFGVTGQKPSHPELLDDLAVRFQESGWSVKSMVREIASSHVYRISTEFDEAAHRADPDNELLWRANPRRLEAEAIRDAMLGISGEIDLERPRGSEVAKAGYQRVVGGFLGDPRELALKARESAERELRATMRERVQQAQRATAPRFRPGIQPPLGRTPGRRGPFAQRPRNAEPRNAEPRNAEPQSANPSMSLRGPFQGGGEMGFDSMVRDFFQSRMREVARKIETQLDMEDAKYRSVYLPIVRDNEPRSLVVFDLADSSTVSGTRESSNTANQALFMLNNPFVIQQSEAFADRLLSSEPKTADQIQLAFRLVYGRPPSIDERAAASALVHRFAASGSSSDRDRDALAVLCQSLFASAEFRYLD